MPLGNGWAGGTGAFTDADQWLTPVEGEPPSPPAPSFIAFYNFAGDVLFSGNANYGATVGAPMTFDLSGGGYTLTTTAIGGPGGLQVNSTGTLEVTGAGGALTTNNVLDYGALTIDGAIVNDTDAVALPGGTAEVLYAPLVVTNGGILAIANGSTNGELYSDNGAILVQGGTIIAPTFINDGSLTVTSNGSFVLGYAGQSLAQTESVAGTITVSDGGVFQALGNLLAVTPAVTLDGGTMTVAGTLEVVNGGSITVQGGALLTADTIEAQATLNVLSGGTVTAAEIQLTGSVTISGAGSEVAADGTLDIEGDVAVTNGGSVNAEADLDAGGSSTLDIGTASSVQVAGTLYAGDQASDGGLISVSGTNSLLNVLGDSVIASAVNTVISVTLNETDHFFTGHYLDIGYAGQGIVEEDGAGSFIQAGQDIDIGNTGNGSLVAMNGGSVNAEANFNLGVGVGGTALLDIESGSSVQVANTLTAGEQASSSSSIIVNGSSSFLDVLGNSVLASAVDSIISVTLNETDHFFTGHYLDIGYAGQAVVDEDGEGSLIQAGQDIDIGNTGNGSLVAMNGGSVNAEADLNVGAGIGGTALLDIESGSSVQVANTLTAGEQASSISSIIVNGSSSFLDVLGNSVLASAVNAFISVTLNETDHFFTGHYLDVGYGGQAVVDEDGEGSLIQAGQDIDIGNTGTGELDVANGGSVNAQADLNEGSGAGGTGTLKIKSGGGVLITGSVVAGQQTSSNGTIIDDGAGSQLNAQTATIGDSGNGSLTVSNGASFDVGQDLIIAMQPSSTSTVTVTGAGSMLDAATAGVGGSASSPGGTAQFDILNGGSVTVTGATTIAQQGTAQVSGGGSSLDTQTLVISGDGMSGGGVLLAGSSGDVIVSQAVSLMSGGSIDTTGGGDVSIDGGAAAAGMIAIGESGMLLGDGMVSAVGIALAGEIDATGGTLSLTGSLAGTDGTMIIGDGAVLDVSRTSDAIIGTIDLGDGSLLNIGATDLTVVSDFDDPGFGEGNAFDARADVTGSGQIIGQDAALTVVGDGVTDGDSTAPTLTFTDDGTGMESASFTIENSGDTATIRGAVQTIGLSGGVSGITAGNFALAPGALSMTYMLSYDGDPNALDGQSIRIVSNFDNVAPITLSLESAGSGPLPCFAAGTRIATAQGEIAVEAIAVGAVVRVVVGERLVPVIWVGRREVDCAGHAQPRKVWPIRVRAGAFGPCRPHRDLFLSPDHAVYIDEVLIPIRHLVNATTIAQVPMDRVTYYHIELPQHDVLLAEGLPAESFLDMRDGSNYANRPGLVRLYPDYSARMWEAFGCAPLIVTGPELIAARALVARFVTDLAAA